jgi:hypothetical protein
MLLLSDQEIKNYQEHLKDFKENPLKFNLEGKY